MSPPSETSSSPQRSTSRHRALFDKPQDRYVLESSRLGPPVAPNLLVSKSPCLFLLPPLLVCRIRRIYARGHAQTQLVLRVLDEHTHFVNQASAQFLGLHRFGRELSDWRNKTDPTIEAALWETIYADRGSHPGVDFAQIRFRDVSSHPFGIGDSQRENRALRRRHLSRLHDSRTHHGIHRRSQLRVSQLLAQASELRFVGVQARLVFGDVFFARTEHGQV